MGKVLFMRKGEVHTAPSVGLELSTIAEGSIVKLNENGSPVEFYVAKHNYEESLNGAGRTLLVRKDGSDATKWHSVKNLKDYATSDIDTWLNGTYKALLDTAVQEAIKSTTFYYGPTGIEFSNSTLTREVFLLSLTELDKEPTTVTPVSEGSALPIASALQIATNAAGTAVDQWTRTTLVSSSTSTTANTYYVTSSGGCGNALCTTTRRARPAFTLPSTALFDANTLNFIE